MMRVDRGADSSCPATKNTVAGCRALQPRINRRMAVRRDGAPKDLVAACWMEGLFSTAIGKRWATREDLSRKSTVSRELVADYWMEGL
jgi:hypothetical protein